MFKFTYKNIDNIDKKRIDKLNCIYKLRMHILNTKKYKYNRRAKYKKKKFIYVK